MDESGGGKKGEGRNIEPEAEIVGTEGWGEDGKRTQREWWSMRDLEGVGLDDRQKGIEGKKKEKVCGTGSE